MKYLLFVLGLTLAGCVDTNAGGSPTNFGDKMECKWSVVHQACFCRTPSHATTIWAPDKVCQVEHK
jgi:hypothetical protein